MTVQMYDSEIVVRENQRARTAELAREVSTNALKVISGMMVRVCS